MIDQSTTGIQSILKAEFSLQNIRSFISCTVFCQCTIWQLQTHCPLGYCRTEQYKIEFPCSAAEINLLKKETGSRRQNTRSSFQGKHVNACRMAGLEELKKIKYKKNASIIKSAARGRSARPAVMC